MDCLDEGILLLFFALFYLYLTKTSKLKNEIKDLKKKLKEEERKSCRDPMTGSYNRRVIEQIVIKEIDRAIRYNHHFSCLFVDLDNFKLVNDFLGHKKGDEIIKEVAKILLSSVRCSDYVVRTGGDEFLVLLTETHCDQGEDLAKRLSAEISALIPDSQKLIGARFGASIGCVSLDNGESFDDMVSRADRKMYEVKDRRKK